MIKERCQKELHIIKYFGLPEDVSFDKVPKVIYADLVDLLYSYEQSLIDKGRLEPVEGKGETESNGLTAEDFVIDRSKEMVAGERYSFDEVVELLKSFCSGLQSILAERERELEEKDKTIEELRSDNWLKIQPVVVGLKSELEEVRKEVKLFERYTVFLCGKPFSKQVSMWNRFMDEQVIDDKQKNKPLVNGINLNNELDKKNNT